ncbi:pyruvate ferredoxin oxidoreductase [Sulfolobus acidocaldarius]|uniref:2-oxoacid oxidoreductase (ferredoxin) n=4 Tax=Sulfolobus acidocaldarius TaxID=2285 RepID=Q4J6P3_SULAC|nr:pyruvate ferredoxin oxidoreductase [Sulfolobus acidocaldarius]AAY81538.1 pyruvate synthase alpha chain [Sulfolobus acidocaldarius DSM 639]AGE72141.1 pyruvate flavodoxin/ferredoxin oxidoreductase domain protein [Sulfolobus acidocaldarius N8]AGE74458.1 pyruvate flavodoxin/ferredoxin oxidoreductase domain protein [Sulfolobus acidocaldarius Ron12/I]ALU29686.1 pyruvate ferredoxin oxidoreductase [Sulfolobus acidocaldarius]ALU32421.1 pyruvate ferredoxin oxidoreductase [Sulfolobus acidocaldarius]
MIRKIISGNEAVATAVKLARVGLTGIYPITPQTSIIEKLAEMKAQGEIQTEIVRVESEHSAMAATYGAALAGIRAFTATASQGLLYMHEMVWWVAGSRVPVVMVVGTRAVGAPWNIWNEHTDFTSERDSGWIMAFASNPQEALDLTIQAFRISEDERVFLPVMVGMDGFILSHTKTNVLIPDQEQIDDYLPPRRQPYVIDPEDPVEIGNMFPPEGYMKLRESIHLALKNSEDIIRQHGREYNKKVSPMIDYSTLNSSYRLEDADYAVVLMGAWAGDAMEAIDVLREKGIKIGMLRVRYLRPWSEKEIRENLEGKKGVLVLDRSTSFGRGGPLYIEVKSTIRDTEVKDIVTGLGGVTVGKSDMIYLFSKFVEGIKEDVTWYYPKEVGKLDVRTPRDIE